MLSILNLDLFRMFNRPDDKIYRNKTIPDTFKSHSHYRDIWFPLFQEEVYH